MPTIAESSSALPSEQADAVAGEFSPDDSTDSERDEASDDEIHDVALAVEKSSYSAHGHEVTSPPSDDDQGETIRIVTEAVEQSEPGAEADVPSAPAREPAVSSACFHSAVIDLALRHGVSGEGRTIGPTTYPRSRMINPNHREDTQVAAGLGNRSQIREELPLSTRVHELAKELGLKSQELLERIQKWGLDVKANALASLDPPMVDRIRELMDQPAAGRGRDRSRLATPAAAQSSPPPASSRAAPPRASGARRNVRRHGPGRSRHRLRAGSAHELEPMRPGAGTGAGVASRRRLAAPQRLIPGSSPSASARPPASSPVGASAASAGPRGGAARVRGQPAPLARPGGFSGTRPAGGPLSAHTPHRGTGPRPGGPSACRTGSATRARAGQPVLGRRRTASRTGGLPAPETRRLHVVGGNPHR